MKIEIGFQSNCSELVTHVGALMPDEIRAAIERITKITDWNWGLEVDFNDGSNHQIFLPIPRELIHELIEIIGVGEEEIIIDDDIDLANDELYEDYGYSFSSRKIINYWKEQLDNNLLKQILNKPIDDYITSLYLYKGPTDNLIEKPERGQYLEASIDCANCDKRDMKIECDEYDTNLIPSIHAISKAFNSPIEGHDGGSIERYIHWLRYHFVNQSLSKKNKEKFEYLKDAIPLEDNWIPSTKEKRWIEMVSKQL